ncbi:unnamed protein product [Symbiodinium natans]|uniref:Uncharacterized protein n=1 Tax=Symbiodinium natans TaxID=878477 RepID=A0A812KFV2_9DINO|nr:unnamed protein product [Symbiodinium natans]
MAGDPPADCEKLPDITDQVAERLLRSLELMEADYQRTLAAEPVAPQPLQPTGLLHEQADTDEECASGGEHGYAALGSEGGRSMTLRVVLPLAVRGTELDLGLDRKR